MHVVPEAVFDKMQAYPTPENVKEVQDFVGIWGFGRTFILHLAKGFHPLGHLAKKGTYGTGHQSRKLPLRWQKY